jgi:RNA polymerase sigma factor (TIGR02999 family)
MTNDPANDVATRLQATLYAELRKLARARMARMPAGSTLQPTALVHEAYLRLAGKDGLHLEDRRHFFFAAARAMRDILVENARRKSRSRRGGGRRRVELDEDAVAYDPHPADVLAVSEALDELEKEDPLLAQVVSLRYFAGMTVEEAAEVLGISESTLHRHWRFASALLKSRLGGSADTR